MNRHQLLACASAEMQTALKTYTHDDLPRTVTDTAAIDVLSALREGLRITTIQQLDALPDGCVVRDQRGFLWETDQGHMYAASYAMPMCIKTVALPAVIVWNPEWEKR